MASVSNPITKRGAAHAAPFRISKDSTVRWRQDAFSLSQKGGMLLTKEELDVIVKHSVQPFLNALAKHSSYTPSSVQQLNVSFDSDGGISNLSVGSNKKTRAVSPQELKSITRKSASIVHKVGLIFADATLTLTACAKPAEKPLEESEPFLVDIETNTHCASYALGYAELRATDASWSELDYGTDLGTPIVLGNLMREGAGDFMITGSKKIIKETDACGLMTQIAKSSHEASMRGDLTTVAPRISLFEKEQAKSLRLAKQALALALKNYNETDAAREALVIAYGHYMKHSGVYLDSSFFETVTRIQATKLQIVLMTDKEVVSVYPLKGSQIIDPDQHTYFIYRGNHNYESVNTRCPQVTKIIKAHNRKHSREALLERFFALPTAESLKELKQTDKHAYLAILSLNKDVEVTPKLANDLSIETVQALMLKTEVQANQLVSNATGRVAQALDSVWKELSSNEPDEQNLKAALGVIEKDDLKMLWKLAALAFRKERLLRNVEKVNGISNREEFPFESHPTAKKGFPIEKCDEDDSLSMHIQAIKENPILALKREGESRQTFDEKMGHVRFGRNQDGQHVIFFKR